MLSRVKLMKLAMAELEEGLAGLVGHTTIFANFAWWAHWDICLVGHTTIFAIFANFGKFHQFYGLVFLS